MQDMVWNVYCEDFNGKRITVLNIFDHRSFNEDVKMAYKKYKDDFDKFSESVKSSLKYYYWGKAEYEILIDPWIGNNVLREEMEIKVDVYDQVMLNWDIFIKYVWEQAHVRKTRRKK